MQCDLVCAPTPAMTWYMLSLHDSQQPLFCTHCARAIIAFICSHMSGQCQFSPKPQGQTQKKIKQDAHCLKGNMVPATKLDWVRSCNISYMWQQNMRLNVLCLVQSLVLLW